MISNLLSEKIGLLAELAWMKCPLLLAQGDSRTTYEWARLENYTERWHYLVLIAVCAAVLAFVGWMYRRDSYELGPIRRAALLSLRVLALVGLLLYYLDPVKRTEQQQVRNSRALVLVDTSLSMGLHDAESSSIPASPTRIEQVTSILDSRQADASFLKQLRERHDLVVARFDGDFGRLLSVGKVSDKAAEAAVSDSEEASSPTATEPAMPVWSEVLRPRGGETRLGQALNQFISEQRAHPVTGLIVFTDGGQNAGIDPLNVVELARQAKVPIYPVGIGSDQRPINVRIADFLAPARAYPGDGFTITGYIQAQELAGRSVTVELTSHAAGKDAARQEGELVGTDRILLAGKGELVPIKFEILPKEPGRRTYRLRVKSPPEDTNPADDVQEADVEVVDRKTKVLLVASGPMREYIFLRNQLRRDREMVVDVWLQSAPDGISQDANEILTEFPSTPQEMFEYDAIVGFDPDWSLLDDTQLDLLERWVADKAGGMVVIAGAVAMEQWVNDARMGRVRSLYPVEFQRRLSLAEDNRYGSDTPWPVQFTREGLEAEFLWLSDTPAGSSQNWAEFPGVFSCYSVRGPKPAATVFARMEDPAATAAGDAVYMAEQFYGSGRVFYLGSGEMWRLRSLDEAWFEQFYTKLVRHVSQGRLLLGSSRGMLLVDRDRYVLGNTVVLRANVFDSQFAPLVVNQLPVQVVQPDSTVMSLELTPDESRQGMYLGQFTALQEGTYRIELPIPESDGEQLSRRIQVKMPDLERENPQRNDALLSELAKQTGGRYYVGADAVMGGKGMPPLVAQLADRTEETYLPGVIDRDHQKHWMQAILALVCGALCVEWLVRRLSKLA